MSAESAPTTPQEQLQLDLYNAMAERLGSHAGSDSRLVTLDYDPDKYPAQRLDAYCVRPKGDLAPLDWIDGIGRMSMDNYDEIADELRDPASDQHQWLSESAERMAAGESSVFATPHLELTGVAVALGTAATALRRDGHEFETALDFFRMMSVAGWSFKTGMEPAACIDVAHMFTNHILQAVTKSSSTHQSGLIDVNPSMPEFVRDNNKRVKTITHQLLGRGGVMLGLAYNGSVWKRGVAERVTAGTTEMMTHPNAHVLEVNFAITAQPDGHQEGYLEIAGPPRKLTSEEEVHDVAERAVQKFNDRSEARGEGRPYNYETAEEAAAARQVELQAQEPA